MARIRSLKPEFWADEYLAENTSREARLLYMALWNLADEHARARAGARYLKGHVFPYDDDISALDIDVMLDQLEAIGRIQRYSVDRDCYLFLPKLSDHQRLEPGKAKSRYPEPPPWDGDIPVDSPLVLVGENPDESAPDTDESALLLGVGVLVDVKNPSSAVAAPRPDIEDLCELLADLIEKNGSKRPRVTGKWRTACRLLIDRDGRTYKQVADAIRWSQADEFWRANILSMPKLREKYDQLRLAAQARSAPVRASGAAAEVPYGGWSA